MANEIPKPEAHFHLSSHSMYDASYLRAFEITTRALLEDNRPGNIYVFVEEAFMSASAAADIQKLTSQGIPVSLAYAVTREEAGSIVKPGVTIDKIRRFAQRFYRQPEHAYEAAEFGVIDKLQYDYWDENTDQPQLGVIFEQQPDEIHDISVEQREDYDANHDMQKQFLNAGKFDQALVFFQKRMDYLAHNSDAREQRMLETLQPYLDDTNTKAIVVVLGTTHTPLMHEMQRQGILTKATFVEKEDGFFQYDPANIIMRKIRFGEIDSISELEWFQGMIGEYYLDLLATFKYAKHPSSPLKDSSYQELTGMVLSLVANSTMQDFRDLEVKTRNLGGIIEAIE